MPALATARPGVHGGCRPLQAGRVTHAGGERCAPVAHAEAVVGFYTRGSLALEMGDTWRVGEGDVVLIPAGTRHRAVGASGAELWGLSLQPGCGLVGARPSLLAPLDRVREGAAPIVHIPPHRRGFLGALFEELAVASTRPPDEGLDLVQESLVTLILAEVDRATPAAPPRPGGIVPAALRHIELHCLGPLTVEDVAAAVGRTPAHLTTVLRRETGRTATGWITTGRMAEARRLLLASSERVDAVAARVGYADVTHFIRTFRRHHGATPSAWRASRARAVTPGASGPSPDRR